MVDRRLPLHTTSLTDGLRALENVFHKLSNNSATALEN